MPSPTLYILHTSKTFDHLVVALATLPIDLVNVRACTFPGRPEPRLASWVTRSPDPTHLLLFDYIPDLHLRTLTLLAALPGELGLDDHLTLPDLLSSQDEPQQTTPWFERWSDLRQALHHPEHMPAQRAAIAWRVRGEVEHAAITRTLCASVLSEGLLQGSVSARRACAEQMSKWPIKDHLEALRQARDQDEDVEVRVHAQRAIDQILTKTR